MKCHQCGTEIFEGNSFCHVCGATVAPVASQNTPTQPQDPTYTPPVQPQNPYVNNYGIPTPPPAPAKKKGSKLPVIIAAVALVAAIGIVLAIVLGGGSDADSSGNTGSEGTNTDTVEIVVQNEGFSTYRELVTVYLEYEFYDYPKLIDLYHGNHLSHYLAGQGMTLSELEDHYQQSQEDTDDEFDELYGTGWYPVYLISNVVSHTGSELQEIVEIYEQYGMEVTGAMTVELDMEIKGTKQSAEFTGELQIIQVGSAWFLANIEA